MPDLGLARDASHVTHFRNGDHLCLFYNNLDEQIATLGPFVHLGLNQNERCVCIQAPEARKALTAWLVARGVNTERQIDRGALVFGDPAEVYHYKPDGTLDAESLLHFLDQSLREALAQGFSGFRPTGEVVWSLTGERCAQLIDYETRLNGYFPGKRSVGMCQYNTRIFNTRELAGILAVHKVAMLSTSDARSMRIRGGNKFADIVGRPEEPGIFSFKIHRDGSGEVLCGGQEQSLSTAIFRCQRLLSQASA